MLKKQSSLLLLLLALATFLHAQQPDWVKTTWGSPETWGRSLAHCSDGGVVVVGYFGGTIDLDPGAGNHFETAGSGYNTYIQKLDSTGQFLWGGHLHSGPYHNVPVNVEVAANGDIVVAGQAYGPIDLDPSAGVDSVFVASMGSYLVRLSASGQYLGSAVIDNTVISTEDSRTMALDPQGRIYLAGSFFDTVDFDLGPGQAIHTVPQGSMQAFLVSYDASLNLRWANIYATGIEQMSQNVVASSTAILYTAQNADTVDVDAGPGQHLLINAQGSPDVVIAQYDFAGQLQWAYDLGEASDVDVRDVTSHPSGHWWLGGSYRMDLDADPGTGVHALPTQSLGTHAMLIELDALGNYVSAPVFVGASASFPFVQALRADAVGSLYALVSFPDQIDLDPGLGQDLHTPLGGSTIDLGFVKLNAQGQLIWSGQIGSGGNEYAYSLDVDADQHIFSTGTFAFLADFDPRATDTLHVSAQGARDAFVFRWGQDACADLTLVIDSVQAVGCAQMHGYAGAHAQGGTLPYSYSWNTIPSTPDSVMVPTVGGLYTLTVSDSAGCIAQRGVLIDAPSVIGGYDLEVNVVAGTFRPGLPTLVTLDAFNNGCTAIGGQIKFVLDPLVSLQSSNPAPTSIVGDTLVWNFAPMNFDFGHFTASMVLLTPITAQGGDTVHFAAIITPVIGDNQPQDNVRLDYSYRIVNSNDPNAKSVYPAGQCEEHYVLRTDPLTYTIQFQNTGTAEALEIYILDTIDAGLQLSTLALKGSSHPMVTEILPGNIVKFLFHDIHLPDSTTNEPASHGYVIYELLPQPSILSGTEIHNGSAIYFDFNAPVLTNEVMSTVVDVIPACSVGLPAAAQEVSWQLFPNPATGQVHLRGDIMLGEIVIFNALGQKMMHLSTDQQEVIVDAQAWPAGVYFVRVGGEVRRLVVE